MRNKIISVAIELFLLSIGLYFFITVLAERRGYYGIGEGYSWVQLFYGVMLLLSILFYTLVRIGIETKQKFWFFIPAIIYLLIMLIGPGWFSQPFFQAFSTLGMVGLLFVALPIITLLILRHLFLKILIARRNKRI